MNREDKIRAVWIVSAFIVLIVCVWIWPDFFTTQLFDSQAALWITIGVLFAVSCFVHVLLRKRRDK